MPDGHRLGVDIGGTFTDFVLLDAEAGPARRQDADDAARPARAVLDGCRALVDARRGSTRRRRADRPRHDARHQRADRAPGRADRADHDARASATCSRCGREMRYDIYDLAPRRCPTRSCRAALRFEVDERLPADGASLTPLDRRRRSRRSAARSRDGRRGGGGLLPARLHERRARASIAGAACASGAGADGHRCPASVAPEIREYERTSTTVANAYVQPLARALPARLERRAAATRGFDQRLLPDALERRHHDARRGDALPDPARRVGPGGRRARGGHWTASCSASPTWSRSTWAARPPRCA